MSRLTQRPLVNWRSISASGGVTWGGWGYKVGNSLKSWSLQDCPAYPGLMRFEVRSGDQWAQDVAAGSAAERSEIDMNQRVPYFQDLWVAYDFMILPGDPVTASFLVVGQWHSGGADSTADKAASPPFAFQYDNGDGIGGNLYLSIRSDPDFISPWNPPPTIFEVIPNLVRGRWYSIVARCYTDYRLYSDGGQGSGQVWVDGTQVVSFAQPVGYNDALGPFWKLGGYRGPAAESVAVIYNNLEISAARSLSHRIAASPKYPPAEYMS